MSGLNSNTEHAFYVLARNGDGELSAIPASTNWATLKTLPKAPTSIVLGTPTQTTVPLTLEQADGIDTFRVTFSAPANTPSVELTTSDLTIKNLASETTYTFTVAAKNSDGSYSAESAEKTVTTATPPPEETDDEADKQAAITAIILIFLFVVLAIIIVVVGARFVKKDAEAKTEDEKKDFDPIPENKEENDAEGNADQEDLEANKPAEHLLVPTPGDNIQGEGRSRAPTMKLGGASQVLRHDIQDDDDPIGESTIKSVAREGASAAALNE